MAGSTDLLKAAQPATRAATLLVVLAGISLVLLGAAILTSRWVSDLLLQGLALARGAPVASDWPRNLHLTGAEALFDGVLCVIVGAVVLPRQRQVLVLLEKPRVLIVSAAAVLVALWMPVIVFGRSAVIGGERYWWLGDDAMISMRYARNLAHGLGLVWNAGERVEGYTNFLWTVYMALVHLLPIPASKTSLVILLTNVVLGIATIPSLIRLTRALGGSTPVVVAAVASFVLSMNTMYWATYGYETALLTLLLVVAADRALRDALADQPTVLTYVLIGSIALVRADGIVISALLCGVSTLLSQRSRKTTIAYSGVSLLMPVTHEVFRISYYGDVLPNTAYLKAMNWSTKYIAGISYVAHFAMRYAFPMAFAVIGALGVSHGSSGGIGRETPSLPASTPRAHPASLPDSALIGRLRARRYLVGAILVYMGYVAYVGGDAFGDYRFFVPILPLLMALAFVGVQDFIVTAWRHDLRAILGALCLFTIPLVTPGYVVALFPYPADPGNVEIGLYLKENTPATSRVADFWAGSVFYFSDSYGIDLLGKSDRYLAHMPVASAGLVPGHNKYDFDYSLGVLKPDFVIAHFRLPVTDEEMRREATGDFAYVGQLYFSSVFRQHCLSHPLSSDTWRTIFACDWSH